ncbi:hypothetical protein OsI_09761 [Oryza sativa Indica Group]|uniref:Uncharacterized protein n=1 Tax=Oryza sativa subsp. indica TaxID=39946 RepID=B8ALW7_ORYSI|nr:hypothetical protein OsI_09761 [Oryza sativa Indica Group]
METGGTERQMRWEGEQKLEPLSPPAPARPRACTHASPACTRSARMRSEAQIDRFSRAWLGSPICTRGARLGWPCRQPNTKGLHPWMRASQVTDLRQDLLTSTSQNISGRGHQDKIHCADSACTAECNGSMEHK